MALRIDEMDNRVAFPMLLMRVAISTLIPASNKMMLRARTLVKQSLIDVPDTGAHEDPEPHQPDNIRNLGEPVNQ